MVLNGAPIASIKSVSTDEVQGTCDQPAVPPRHDEERILCHALANETEKFPCEVGRAPLARSGVHVEGKEGVPVIFGEVASGHPFDGDAVFPGAFAFLADHLALA